jgi:hypothetical protein
MYCSSAWFTLKGKHRHRNSAARALESIQHRAARVIEGAFRATSAAALNLELFLLPTQKQLEKLVGEAVLRICSNPFYKAIRDTRRTPSRTRMEANEDWDRMPQYWSPLEKLVNRVEQRSGLRIKNGLEQRRPWVVEPWWEWPSVIILGTQDEVKKKHEQITAATGQQTIIYTDGSDINSKMGAAAVSPDGGLMGSACLGKETEYTVYAAELLGILMALSMVERYTTDSASWTLRESTWRIFGLVADNE